VKDWSEESRYEATTSEQGARDMYAAVTDASEGIVTWLKKYW
jgi:hypothetical protein